MTELVLLAVFLVYLALPKPRPRTLGDDAEELARRERAKERRCNSLVNHRTFRSWVSRKRTSAPAVTSTTSRHPGG